MGPDGGTITCSKILIGHRCVDHSDDSRNVFVEDAFVPPCHVLVRGSIIIDWDLVDRLTIESTPSLLVTDTSQILSQGLLVRITFFFLDMLIQGVAHRFLFNLHLQQFPDTHDDPTRDRRCSNPCDEQNKST